MILALFCYAAAITLFIAIAFSVSLLWVKIVCWSIVGVLTLVVLFAFIVSRTYGKIGRGDG